MERKALTYLTKRLTSVVRSDFEEDDIKLLLIEIRDYLEDENFLREICDFVAHPKRNKGICHKRIDSRYSKFKFSKEGTDKLMEEGIFRDNPDKPWSFFSDQILSYIETEKIPKKLFELIIQEGIEEIDEELFIKNYKLKKEGVRILVKTVYTKQNGFYVLDNSLTESEKNIIDDVLKFISGTITGKAAFSQSEIQHEFLQAIERVLTKHKLDIQLKDIESQLEDILVCVLSILHDSIFDLFDGEKASSYLSVQSNEGQPHTLCIMVNAKNFSFPIVTTEIHAEKYIQEFDSDIRSLSEIEFVYAVRDKAGELVLTKNEA